MMMSLIDVRYAAGADQLWVSFSDGTTGSVNWTQLELEDVREQLIPESPIVGEYGSSVETCMNSGEVFDLDAIALKALLDDATRARPSTEAARSDAVVGMRIRARREAVGLSQRALGKATGIDQAIISKLERGLHRPRVDTLRRMAAGLGLTLGQLLTEDGTRTG